MDNKKIIEKEQGWSTVGAFRKSINNKKRKIKKQQVKLQIEQRKDTAKQHEKEQEAYRRRKKNDWREKRISLIKEKEIQEYQSRKITSEFSQAIQHQRTIANMTRKELALKIMIQESELTLFETAKKCPTSRIVVELRKVFENLPRKYFLISK